MTELSTSAYDADGDGARGSFPSGPTGGIIPSVVDGTSAAVFDASGV